MIESILIANRGEIACRVIATCKRLGIRSVAVYSDADSDARHVKMADEAVHIGANPALESYLVVDAILRAAQLTGAAAVHPGFGFLAESAAFARACAGAGLLFIGPKPEAIEAMGNKRKAKQLMQKAGIPTIPGYGGPGQSDPAFLAASHEIGFPVMVKAAAGGGGRGMRLVSAPDELQEALAAARREAGQAFGSDELILERSLVRPRHIEFQLLGDAHGHVIHLGERECSVQRRYQKVIEETPATGISAELRAEMGAAAIAAAQMIEYVSAGTVEFLLEEDGDFYFLEFNTRIQVEHPVTEMVTGLDLVAWQIRIAEGEPLPWTQEAIQTEGHAIEARLYAENPVQGFLPVTGDILLWRPPSGDGIRVDSGIQSQDSVSIHYDPMIAKVIAHGPNRKTALRRLAQALARTDLLGVTNNLDFLQAVLRHPAFRQGKLHTGFIDEHMESWRRPEESQLKLALIAASLVQFTQHPQLNSSAGYWRNSPNRPNLYRYLDQPDVTLMPKGSHYLIGIDGQEHIVESNRLETHNLTLTVDGHRQKLAYAVASDRWWVRSREGVVTLQAQPLLPVPELPVDAAGSLRASMPGAVIEVLVEVGQAVTKGQALMKIEAMKMEHTIRVAADGVVEAIYYQAGDNVEADAQLLKIVER